MKRKLMFLFSLFIIFGFFVLARYIYLKLQATDGALTVLSSPASEVTVDGKVVGKTPFEGPFKTGEYLITLAPDQSASDAASWKGKIRINAQAVTFVDRELGANDISSSGVILTITKMDQKPESDNTGQIKVDTEPTGAIVYLDNEEVGIAPFLLSEVTAGDHELSVLNPGFFRRSQKVKVENGYQVQAQFKLSLDPTYKKIEPKKDDKKATDSATLKKTPTEKSDALTIAIQDTETGWLRVRENPTTSASESAKVNPGDEFEVLAEQSGWYQIEYVKGKKGWISARYAKKID